jgi:hypothetical protein
MASVESEIDALKKRFDVLDAGMRAAVDRLDHELANVRTALNALAANDKERNDAACVSVDAVREIAATVARVQATLDLFLHSSRTVQ